MGTLGRQHTGSHNSHRAALLGHPFPLLLYRRWGEGVTRSGAESLLERQQLAASPAVILGTPPLLRGGKKLPASFTLKTGSRGGGGLRRHPRVLALRSFAPLAPLQVHL